MLTILMATKNRADLLQQVLETYCALQVPKAGWKILVIDNGSDDNTVEIVRSFQDRLPIDALIEPRAGKNAALNKGLEHIEGDLVVLTDDDAFPRADWLLQLRRAADERPDYSIFGGVVIPRWETSPPSWIRWVDLAPTFTVTDPTLQEGPIEPHHVFGPNMAIRASVFRPGARFDTSIGPRGTSYAMGSETEFVERLGRAGAKAWHTKGAVVEHFIRQEQLKMEWVLGRAIRLGRGQYRLYGAAQDADALSFRGVPVHLFRRAFKQAVLAIFTRVGLRREAHFRACWRLNVLRGKITEAREIEKEKLVSGSARPAFESEKATHSSKELHPSSISAKVSEKA